MAEPVLKVSGLHVTYGRAHVLQGVDLSLGRGILSVVGRNGMGKTTLCNAIMGLVPASGGSVRVAGSEVLGRAPNRIVGRGVAYVPQGRRVWPSLSVDEHLRLAAGTGRTGAWTVERVYDTFPRLKQRSGNGGAQLSGGEQQMLAIGRALLSNPRLLVMDEPTEGLAPVIVEQVAALLKRLGEEGEMSILLIEQNLGVATEVGDRVAVMINGRVVREMPAADLAADSDLQHRLLGMRTHDDEEPAEAPAAKEDAEAPPAYFQVRRASQPDQPAQGFVAGRTPTRWSQGNPAAGAPARPTGDQPQPTAKPAPAEEDRRTEPVAPPVASVARLTGRNAYVVGTFDTKGRELTFVSNCLQRMGLRVVTVDLSTSGKPSPAMVHPREVARHHPRGAAAVFTGDRGSAVAAMAEAFEHFIVARRDLGGIISAGGSGGTALATPAMQHLPIGTPKVMVSTVASGDVRSYVGPSDICMMYSVTDVAGINRISEQVLSNAAHALGAMIAHRREAGAHSRPALGLTMFGVTTPCVQMVSKALEEDYDCLVFHATGTGGRSMEKLADSGLLAGVLDISTTEVCDHLVGGVMSAGPGRLDAIARSKVPYVGSCGALDMVNFGAMDTVPAQFRGRTLYAHNPQVTLMRTTAEECAAIGRFIAGKLNRCDGPVRFVIPEGGVSLLDVPGKPFHDPAADAALFKALEETLRPGPDRRLLRLPYAINDPAFAHALVEQFRAITGVARAA